MWVSFNIEFKTKPNDTNAQFNSDAENTTWAFVSLPLSNQYISIMCSFDVFWAYPTDSTSAVLVDTLYSGVVSNVSIDDKYVLVLF